MEIERNTFAIIMIFMMLAHDLKRKWLHSTTSRICKDVRVLHADEMSSSDSTDSEEALQFSDTEFDEDCEQLAAEVTLTGLLCKLQPFLLSLPSSSILCALSDICR